MSVSVNAIEATKDGQIAITDTSAHQRLGRDAYLDFLSLMLNEVDYGMLLLDDEGEVLHLNQVAASTLRGQHPLRLSAEGLSARSSQDRIALRWAMEGALRWQNRSMLCLGGTSTGAHISVMPMVLLERERVAVLVIMGKTRVVNTLSIQSLARSHGLSPGESRVLGRLCAGCSPQEIAEQHGVKIDTVRSQISQIRAKTGVNSIRELIHRAACLPPI